MQSKRECNFSEVQDKHKWKIKSFGTIRHNIRELWLNLSGYQEFVNYLTKNTKITRDIYKVMLENTIEVYEQENLLRHVEKNIKQIKCKKK